jgi:hypothetical protein
MISNNITIEWFFSFEQQSITTSSSYSFTIDEFNTMRQNLNVVISEWNANETAVQTVQRHLYNKHGYLSICSFVLFYCFFYLFNFDRSFCVIYI